MSVGKGLLIPVVILVVLIAANARSVFEGIAYLDHWCAWNPADVQPLARDGPFAICYDLACDTNAGRHERLRIYLEGAGLRPIVVPVPGEPLPDLLLVYGDGPLTLLLAHYDKLSDGADCQGAADNVAAVGVLLAVARELAAQAPERPTAILLTSAEERGLRGAQSFVSWARANGMAVAEVLNLDMIGRGRLAARPSAQPGYHFWLPGVGSMVYDGRRLARADDYPLPDQGLLSRLRAVAGPDLVYFQRFAVQSDSNVFQAAGWPTVALSSDDLYYLNLVWERETDRLELLDQRSLALAYRVVVNYVRLGACPGRR